MKKNILIISILFSLIMSLIFIWYINIKIMPVITQYVLSITTKSITALVNEVISENIDSNEEIVNIIKNNNNIEMLDYNTIKVNNMLSNITKKIIEKINNLELNSEIIKTDSEYIYYVPLGVMTENVLISHFGPKIPIKLNTIGDVKSNINTKITEYGINNALVTISIHININEEVIVPFIKKNNDIELDIPISMKLIKGEVPTYYGGLITRESNILSMPTN